MLEYAGATHVPISRTGTDLSSSFQEQQGQADYLFLHKILSGYFVEVSMSNIDDLPLIYSPDLLESNVDIIWEKYKEKGSFLAVVKELRKPPIMVKQAIELGKIKEKEELYLSTLNEENSPDESNYNFRDTLYNDWEERGDEIYELTQEDKDNLEFLLWKAYQPYLPNKMLTKIQPWDNLGIYSRFVMLSIAFLELFSSFNFDLKRMSTNIQLGLWNPLQIDSGKITDKQLEEYSSAIQVVNSLGMNLSNLTLSDFLILKEKSIKLLTMKTLNSVSINWEEITKNTVASPDLWSEDVKDDVIEISEPNV